MEVDEIKNPLVAIKGLTQLLARKGDPSGHLEVIGGEVERLEHAVSDDLVCRMEEALGFPARDPHGSPIPDRDGKLPTRVEEIILTEAPIAVELEVVRVSDAQPEVLQWLGERGVTPGTKVTITAREPGGGPVLLSVGPDRPVALGGTLARSIEVRSVEL